MTQRHSASRRVSSPSPTVAWWHPLPSPRWNKVGRDLWLHKSRTGLAIAAICAGIIGAGAVLDTWSLVRRATRQEFDASHPASAIIHADSFSREDLVAMRALPGIAAVQLRRAITATIQTPGGGHTALIAVRDDY